MPKKTQTDFKQRPLCPKKRLGHHHTATLDCTTGHGMKYCTKRE